MYNTSFGIVPRKKKDDEQYSTNRIKFVNKLNIIKKPR